MMRSKQCENVEKNLHNNAAIKHRNNSTVRPLHALLAMKIGQKLVELRVTSAKFVKYSHPRRRTENSG